MDLGLVLGVPPYLHRTGWKRFFLLLTLPQGPGAHSVEWAVELDLSFLAIDATWILLVFGPLSDCSEGLGGVWLFLEALGPLQGPDGP